MKIMLLCAGGMSTGILMNKMNNHAGVEVKAFGADDCQANAENFDVILLGPQISYRANEIQTMVSKPVAVIQPLHYALGNVEEIIKLAQATIEEGK